MILIRFWKLGYTVTCMFLKLLDFDTPLLYTCLKVLSTRKCSDFDIGGIGAKLGNFLKTSKRPFCVHFVGLF